MENKIGIPEYKEYVNSSLSEFKKLINGICLDFAAMSCNDAIENRESDKFEVYTKQYEVDLANLRNMVYCSQTLVNQLNDIMLHISTNAIRNKFYEE